MQDDGADEIKEASKPEGGEQPQQQWDARLQN
jgi:hypothetical protein